MFEQPWTGVFPAILCPFGRRADRPARRERGKRP